MALGSVAGQVMMDQKNLEVERATIDMVELVRSYPLENAALQAVDEEVDLLMDHYQRLMYVANIVCKM